MTATTPTPTLGEVVAGGDDVVAPACTVAGDPAVDIVVLAHGTATSLDALADGQPASYDPTITVTEVDDPERQLAVLRAALSTLDQGRREAELRLDVEKARQAAVLDRIRSYAIERHREGMYCEEGLNTFLRHFGLPEYEPSIRVSYTIRGSYRTEGSDPDTAETDAADNLAVDLSEIDGVIASSPYHQVDIDEIETIDC
jgi:hypothetical protein